jgi:Mrp family chromosome partitioning ATPase
VPTLLFFTPRLLELLGEMKRQFDVVLVDTAPALAFPDARLVGKHSDGVVLVLRSGKTPRESAMAVRQRFLEDGVPVLGTILNDWTPSTEQQAYTSYHYYSAYAKERKE